MSAVRRKRSCFFNGLFVGAVLDIAPGLLLSSHTSATAIYLNEESSNCLNKSIYFISIFNHK